MVNLTPTSRQAMEASYGKSLKVPKSAQATRKKSGVLSAFFEFLADMRETGGIHRSLPVTEFSRRGGERWKSMSDGEKQVSGFTVIWG